MTTRQRVGFAVSGLLGGLLFALGGCNHIDDRDINVIGLGELRAFMAEQASEPEDRVLALIDPRNQSRFDAGHLPNARHMLLSDAPLAGGRDPELDGFDNIVVYDQNPGTAPGPAMAKRLMTLKYDDVWLYRDGLDDWISAGLPVVTAADTSVGASDGGG